MRWYSVFKLVFFCEREKEFSTRNDSLIFYSNISHNQRYFSEKNISPTRMRGFCARVASNNRIMFSSTFDLPIKI